MPCGLRGSYFPVPPALEAWSPNHWTARQVPYWADVNPWQKACLFAYLKCYNGIHLLYLTMQF